MRYLLGISLSVRPVSLRQLTRWTTGRSGPSRRDNRECDYDAFVPDLLSGHSFSLDGDVAADVADAEAAIARLNVKSASLVNTESLARILLRAESVAPLVPA